MKDEAGDPTKRRIVSCPEDAGYRIAGAGLPSDPRDGRRHPAPRARRGRGRRHPLPAAGWKGVGSPAGIDGYRYRTRRGRNGPCKKAFIVPGRLLRAVCTGSQIDFTLDEPSQGQLTVTLEPGPGSAPA